MTTMVVDQQQASHVAGESDPRNLRAYRGGCGERSDSDGGRRDGCQPRLVQVEGALAALRDAEAVAPYARQAETIVGRAGRLVGASRKGGKRYDNLLPAGRVV